MSSVKLLDHIGQEGQQRGGRPLDLPPVSISFIYKKQLILAYYYSTRQHHPG